MDERMENTEAEDLRCGLTDTESGDKMNPALEFQLKSRGTVTPTCERSVSMPN